MNGRRWSRSDFAMDAASLAERLLGALLVSVTRGGTRVSGIIVETEAYLGVEDLASHAAGGRRTARNEAMYGPAGTAYVYFTYGMHHCFNIVCAKRDVPAAVLVRALRPVEGLPLMRRRRGAGVADRLLCAGPGRLTRALAIDLRHDGLDLCEGERLWIEDGEAVGEAVRTARVGVGYAGAWARAPLRWAAAGDPHLSKPAKSGSQSGGRRRSGPIG